MEDPSPGALAAGILTATRALITSLRDDVELDDPADLLASLRDTQTCLADALDELATAYTPVEPPIARQLRKAATRARETAKLIQPRTPRLA